MFRPLLAEKIDPEKIEYPVMASPKYDGFRCLINGNGNPVSRNLKPIPNAYVFAKLQEMELPKFDGELLTYTNDKVDDFNTVQSKLTSRTGRPDFKFMVFDYYGEPDEPYHTRNTGVAAWLNTNLPRKYVEHVKQVHVENLEQMLEFEAECLKDGWEGVMARSYYGKYKFGRSTVKEGILLKIKRFFDAEAEVLEAHELVHNANEAVTNALGYTERSSHQDNMVGMDMLGKYTVRWVDRNVQFDIGTGFTVVDRQKYWSVDDRMVGRLLKFKYQSVGPNGKPRFPVFLGFRHKSDLDEDIPF